MAFRSIRGGGSSRDVPNSPTRQANEGGVMETNIHAMSWRYRVYDDGQTHTIREHYEHDGKASYTANPITPIANNEDGDPMGDLRWTLEMMLKALDEPVLKEKE